ncbi:hypothetical protein D3C74_398590 [compost metagenome]
MIVLGEENSVCERKLLVQKLYFFDDIQRFIVHGIRNAYAYAAAVCGKSWRQPIPDWIGDWRVYVFCYIDSSIFRYADPSLGQEVCSDYRSCDLYAGNGKLHAFQ